MNKQTVFPKTDNEHFVYTYHSPKGNTNVVVRQLKDIPEIVTQHIQTSDELLTLWSRNGWKFESAFLLDFRKLNIARRRQARRRKTGNNVG